MSCLSTSKPSRALRILAIGFLFLAFSHIASAQSANSDQNSLELPILTGPQLPLPPPTLTLPEVPSPFLGCWEGNPGAFDTVANDAGVVDIGAPGRIVFCYRHHSIEMPEAQIKIGVKGHVLDVLLHLGLSFSTYKAQGVSTSVFAVTPTQIRARTTLVVIQTEHWLYVIPSRTEQPSEVDWLATLTAPDSTMVQGRQVIVTGGLRIWGAWHGTFHRIQDDTNP
jgi:hypothetical protein